MSQTPHPSVPPPSLCLSLPLPLSDTPAPLCPSASLGLCLSMTVSNTPTPVSRTPSSSPTSSVSAISVSLVLSLCAPPFLSRTTPSSPQASQGSVLRKPPPLPELSSQPRWGGGGARAHFFSSRPNILMQGHYSPGVQAGQASPLLVCHPE